MAGPWDSVGSSHSGMGRFQRCLGNAGVLNSFSAIWSGFLGTLLQEVGIGYPPFTSGGHCTIPLVVGYLVSRCINGRAVVWVDVSVTGNCVHGVLGVAVTASVVMTAFKKVNVLLWVVALVPFSATASKRIPQLSPGELAVLLAGAASAYAGAMGRR